MLNKIEYLLVRLSEECNEVGKDVSKALRFGLADKKAVEFKPNGFNITEELKDVLYIAELLNEEGAIPELFMSTQDYKIRDERFNKYFKLSQELGQVE